MNKTYHIYEDFTPKTINEAFHAVADNWEERLNMLCKMELEMFPYKTKREEYAFIDGTVLARKFIDELREYADGRPITDTRKEQK